MFFQNKKTRIGPDSKNGRQEKRLFILPYQAIYLALQHLVC